MKRGNKEIKLNRINAKVIRGNFKNNEMEIEIGETGDNSKVKVNGKELKNVLGVHIHIRAGETTKLCLELTK